MKGDRVFHQTGLMCWQPLSKEADGINEYEMVHYIVLALAIMYPFPQLYFK
jgi:hypothetical protein